MLERDFIQKALINQMEERIRVSQQYIEKLENKLFIQADRFIIANKK